MPAPTEKKFHATLNARHRKSSFDSGQTHAPKAAHNVFHPIFRGDRPRRVRAPFSRSRYCFEGHFPGHGLCAVMAHLNSSRAGTKRPLVDGGAEARLYACAGIQASFSPALCWDPDRRGAVFVARCGGEVSEGAVGDGTTRRLLASPPVRRLSPCDLGQTVAEGGCRRRQGDGVIGTRDGAGLSRGMERSVRANVRVTRSNMERKRDIIIQLYTAKGRA